MNVAISAAVAEQPFEWCRTHYQYDYDSITWTKDVYFHIANNSFDVPFHYADLVKYAPNIGDSAWSGDPMFANQRDIAINQLYGRIINADRKPWKLLNQSALSIPFAYLWLGHIFLTLSKSPDDQLRALSDEYMGSYDEAFLGVNMLESTTFDTNIANTLSRPIGRTKLERG